MYRTLTIIILTLITTVLAAAESPSISLPDGWRHGLRNQSYSVRLVVTNNDDQARTLCFSSRRGAGASGDPNNVTTADPAVPPCQLFGARETKTLQVGYTMAYSNWDGDAVLAFITAYDQQDPSRVSESWFKITVLMESQAPAPQTLQEGQTVTQTFRFYNFDRFGTTHTYNVTHSATSGAIFGNVSRPSTITIPANQWGDVNVTYTVGPGTAGQSGSLTVQLQDVDPNWQDRIGVATASVNVNAGSAVAPTVQLPDGWKYGMRGHDHLVRLVVTNNTAAPRTLCFSSRRGAGASGNVNNVTTADPSVPPCTPFGALETKTLRVGYTMANGDWDGDAVVAFITAYDQLEPSRAGEAWFKITLLMSSQTEAQRFLQEALTHTHVYRFYNQDRFGTPHTYSVSHTISGSPILQNVSYPSTVTIPAGSWADVPVTFTIPSGTLHKTASLRLRLQDVDPNWPDRIGLASAQITSGNSRSRFNAYSLYRSNVGRQNDIPIQLGPGPFDARVYRQWIGWQGCAPNYYPNGDPDIAYTPGAPEWAAENPGKLWIFLDEPGHGTPWNHITNQPTGCAQVTPEQYARAYHAFVASIRAADPTARFSPGGFEQFPASASAYYLAFIQYAGEFWDRYYAVYGKYPAVDEWRFHVYWEWGGDLSNTYNWEQKTSAAIGFATSHGAPAVIGIGYPWQADDPADPSKLEGMLRMFYYLNPNPSVASVFWFSYDHWQDGRNRLTTYTGSTSTEERTLTPLGERYADLIAGRR